MKLLFPLFRVAVVELDTPTTPPPPPPVGQVGGWSYAQRSQVIGCWPLLSTRPTVDLSAANIHFH